MRTLTVLLGFASCVSHATETLGQDGRPITLRTISGEQHDLADLAIDAQGNVTGSGLAAGLVIDELRRIQFQNASTVAASSHEVILRGGSSMFVSQIKVADETCSFRCNGRDYALPIESIKAVRLDTTAEVDGFRTGVESPPAEYDRVYVRIDNQVQSVSGVVDQVSNGKVVFLFEDSPRELTYAQVYGFIVADFGVEPPPKGNATIHTRDGGMLVGTISEMNSDSIELNIDADTTLSFATSAIREIEIRSSRLVYLSDLEPARVVMRPIVTSALDWQADRSVLGNPLTLKGESLDSPRVFEKGIGTHSESILTFDNDGDFNRLSATIGIDTETQGRGDCEFVVMGDGRELFARRMTAADEPFDLNVDITGVSELTLWVKPGNELDLADHANWCEARLVKSGGASE